jgi:26S proteasome regulatory subunit N11
MEDFMRMFRGGGLGGGGQAQNLDMPKPDTAETIHISSLALLKMLKHGRAGVPLEVMGLMLGEFVDEYTVTVVDVFAMPQSGTGVSVEAVDPVFQTKMLEMLKQTGRPEMVVGWYHSHPGFGCWLSSTDCNTQQSFEQLNPRAVAVVIDPIQSVRGKVVIDAFRLISPQMTMTGQEPRQTTANVGHLVKPSISALIHGLNRHYTSLNIAYRKNELEAKMLLNVHAKSWKSGLIPKTYEDHSKCNVAGLKKLVALAKDYNARVLEEEEKTALEMMVANVGKIDPKRHLQEEVEELIGDNIDQLLTQSLGSMAM